MQSHDSRKFGAQFCEPIMMVEAMPAIIRETGLPENCITTESFPGLLTRDVEIYLNPDKDW